MLNFITKLFFFIGFTFSFSQELPPINNFYPTDYNAENQNWDISQSSDKLIYVANSKGLLEFNGASWKLYPSNNESIMRSVHVVQDRIYTGCFMEFGYWQKNELESLTYTSLSQEIGIDLLEDEEFWNIINIDDSIVFQSLKRIYIYNINDRSAHTIDSKGRITKIFKVDQSIYFQRIGEGIFKIEYGKEILVFEDALVKKNEVINIFGTGQNITILTQNDGLYSLKDNALVKLGAFSNEFLKNVSVYDGIQLRDNTYILGTISNGLLHLNEKGELLFQINQRRGLLNNTVLAVFEDIENNIWLGLDNGISYVNTNSPYNLYTDNEGVLGSIYASAIYKDNLYLGTNQGLFYKPLNNTSDFSFVSGTQGQVWALKNIEGTLFCGHNSGTLIIQENKGEKIPNTQGTWGVAQLNGTPNLLLQGNYDGLYVLEKINSEWKLRNKIENFNYSSRFFETIGNEIFVNHEYKGVFKLTVDHAFTKVAEVVIDTIIKGYNSGIVKYNGDLLYAYKNGVFKYDSTLHKFTRDTLLSKTYDDEGYTSGKLIVDENENKLWIFTNDNIKYINPASLSNTLKIENIPLTKEMINGINGYENILKLANENKYLIGTTSGYITIDINTPTTDDFRVHIGNVLNGSYKSTMKIINKSVERKFKNNENDFEISFYAPEYNKYTSTYYQFQLLGIYDSWSNWSKDHSALFENLPYGEYTFNVKAKIGDTISSNTASYTFSIAKPWYVSNLMIAIYLLGVLLFSILMHNVYKRYYSKQHEKLISENRRELELAQVQNEKEIIKIKNDQLQLEFSNKSKELAASTMSIIKKNELLTTIKAELNSIKDKNSIKPVIQIIDKSLNRNDDWELFQEAFNNADSEFLKKIKKTHASLTPNDLKLCAYLRLNLSSKEIAQLLNISSRSVEIKRYRLRKKLNLNHQENLANYIMNI